MAHYLYRHFADDGTLLYIGISISWIRRLAQHRSHAHWFEQIKRVELESFSTKEEVLAAEREAIIKEKPLFNIHFAERQEAKIENIEPDEVDKKFQWYINDAPGPEWVRRYAVELATGKIFLPCVALGDDIDEDRAFWLASYDSVRCLVDGRHRYYPTDWIKREFPGKEDIERVENVIRNRLEMEREKS